MPNSSTTQQAGLPPAGRYRLEPTRSSVTFHTQHLFGLGAVVGRMEITGGDIIMDPAVPQATVNAAVSAASFRTGNRRRDKDVCSAKFLDTSQYPHITFQAATLTRSGDHWLLAGVLNVCQVSSPVTLAISSVEPAGRGFSARATTRIDRYAFGVTAARAMAGRYLDITLTVTAEPW